MAQPVPPTPPLISFSTDSAMPPFLEQARRVLTGDQQILRQVADAAGGLAVSLTMAGVMLAATLWASGMLSRMTARAIGRAHRGRRADTTLQSFAASLVRYFVIIVGLIGVLQELGVKATSVIAVLGAASLAIGLALQGALSNVAAGVMILILRPYRVGDRVEINGKQGTVRGLDLFSTRLSDPDSLNIFVPNAKAFGEIIVNQTSPASRRAQLDFTIDAEDDVDRALALLVDVAKADPRVVAKPAPWAKLTALKDSGLQVTLRAWFSTEDYWDGRFDLLKAVKDRFDAEGFSFPYPHQVAVEGRKFEAPHSEPAAEPRSFAPKGKAAPAGKETLSRPPAAPRPTRGEISEGR
ncbi:MAG: mechanosensitive ion channel family protein [Phenylobacterium sp.]